MRYENYKLEDCYFMNHGEDWSKEEIDEVLSTFPETKNDKLKIEALNQLLNDIDNNVVKQTKWHYLHPSSAKAYANLHNKIFGYRNESSNKSAGLYIINCGEVEIIRRRWEVESLIKDFEDYQYKIMIISQKYSKKERIEKQNREINEYEIIHADRINQGLKTKQKMYDLELRVCTSLKKESWRDYYSSDTKRLIGSSFINYNRYGEITNRKDELLTIDAGRELENVCDELAKEISEIIDIYNGKFIDIIRKGVKNDT